MRVIFEIGATVIYAYDLHQDCPIYRQIRKDYTAPTGSASNTGENIRASFELVPRRASVLISLR